MEAAQAAGSKLDGAASPSPSPRDKNRSRGGWLAKVAITALKAGTSKRSTMSTGVGPAGDVGSGSGDGSGLGDGGDGGACTGSGASSSGATLHSSGLSTDVPVTLTAAAAEPTARTDSAGSAALSRQMTPPPPIPIAGKVDDESLVEAPAAVPSPSPSRRPRGRGRLRPESIFIAAVSGRLQRRVTTTNLASQKEARHRLGQCDRVTGDDGHGADRGRGGSCRSAARRGGEWDDEDGELDDYMPARMSLELPPRDFSREDRSRRVSPRPIDRMTRTSTARSNQSTASVESGSVLWAAQRDGSGRESGGTLGGCSARGSNELQLSNIEHGHVSTIRGRSVDQRRCSSGCRGLSCSAERRSTGTEGGGGCRSSDDTLPAVDGASAASAPGDSSCSLQLSPLVAVNDAADRPVKHLEATDEGAYASPLSLGGAEGELFGGVGYRRDDFRNLTLLEEKAKILNSCASFKDSTAPSLPPIGEVPCSDMEST
ncbi:hypothetical protein MMPV_005126 [Pyropia vietnamensis]